MPTPLLTVLKLVLLAALYLFVFRAIRVVKADLYGPTRRRATPPPRPKVATAAQPRRPRKIPKEAVVHPPEGRPSVTELTGQAVSFGRSEEADVLVDDVYVSDLHTEIARTDEGWSVRDLGSTNGTFLNGAKVTQPTPLGAGDQIRIGKTRIEVRR